MVPYLTGGLGQWEVMAASMAQAGADALEIGLPFSDPVMDGPVIQEASDRALAAGAQPPVILDRLRSVDAGVPLAVMTYYNLVFRHGEDRFAEDLVRAGAAASIIPDVPLEEAGPWCAAADAAGVETVMLAAPTGDDERLARVCARSRGFVYGVGLLGVTGVRDSLADSAVEIARRLKDLTDLPVLIGVGIGSPEQAVEASKVADGVVVGSRVVAEMLATDDPEAVADVVASFRTALDRGSFT